LIRNITIALTLLKAIIKYFLSLINIINYMNNSNIKEKKMKINFIIITILTLLVMSCDGDSNPASIPGCIDELACNYTSGATADDGSCI